MSASVHGQKLSLSFRSDPAAIADVRHTLERFAESHGIDRGCAGELGLAVNEAIANIIRHAYKGREDEPIELTAEMEGDALVICLRDWGTGEIPNLMRQKTDLSQPGGLGLPCMKQIMDSLEFIPQSDGMLLKMTKRKR